MDPAAGADRIAELAERYAADGVVKLSALLSDDEVAVIRHAVQRFLTGDVSGENSLYFGHGPGRITARWIYQSEPSIPAVLRRSGAAEVVARIIGASRLTVWYDVAFIHEPSPDSGGTGWHHDIPAFPFKGDQNPSLWIPLTPVTVDSSPLLCLKGSHMAGVHYVPPLPRLPSGVSPPDGYVDPPDFETLIAEERYQVLTWTMDIGDALLIHPCTVHGARGNRSRTLRRVAYSVRLMSEHCVWNPDVFSLELPRIDTSALRRGDTSDRLALPVVYERSASPAAASPGL